uniref:Lysozyme C, milk isozyme-like n=1 Tax=Pogona vitticeps TaxID=103695 RepID=A0ABM5FPS2_9SAUR
MKVLCSSLFCLLIIANEARVFEPCELFYLLRSLGLDNHQNIGVKHFVCIALYPSNLNTLYFDVVDGYPRYGIFNLKGREWCSSGKEESLNKCEINCDKFLDDDIKDDVACVKKIVSSKAGIKSWPTHNEHCNINVLSYIFTRCSFFFTNDGWYHKIMRLRLAHTMHIQVTK